MRDLTQGSLAGHLLAMAVPIGVGMLVQTLYILVDLYFVARLGQSALAGVSAAGNLMFVVLALSQILGVGMLSMMALEIGRKDSAQANLVFNQGLGLAACLTVLTLVAGYSGAPAYLQAIGTEPAAASMGIAYLHWYLPGLAMQFALTVLGSAQRAGGVVQPVMLVQLLSVLLNALLAPILIAGCSGSKGWGVAGAGLASSLSIGTGLIGLAFYMRAQRRQAASGYAIARAMLVPRWSLCRRLLAIGIPAGVEFACLFVLVAVIYAAISPFGAAAMAGFGVGSRLLQAIFLPGMAIAFAIPAVVAQNLGAGKLTRVTDCMRLALWLESLLMLGLMLVCWRLPDRWIAQLAGDPRSAAIAGDYLQIAACNFIGTGIVYVCAGLFQGVGCTWPSLISTAARLGLFVPGTLWLARQPDFQLTQLWYWSAVTVALQALLSVVLSIVLWQRHWRPRMLAAPARSPVMAESLP